MKHLFQHSWLPTLVGSINMRYACGGKTFDKTQSLDCCKLCNEKVRFNPDLAVKYGWIKKNESWKIVKRRDE